MANQKRFENVLRRLRWPPRPNETAQQTDWDLALLRELFAALAADVVFQVGAVRVALRQHSIELLTVGGRVGAWFADRQQLFFLAHEDLPANDFLPLPEQDKASHWASTATQAVIYSHQIIHPYVKPLARITTRKLQ
jgi:hypothetical protein